MLTQTKHFHLGSNQLSGDIPSQLFNSHMTMIHLILNNNKLTGSIPSTINLVTSLEALVLSNNKLTGVVDLTGMNALNYLDLSNNTFDESGFPSSFPTLLSMTTLKMQNTNIRGELPSTLFKIPSLQIIDLSCNQLNGTLDMGSNPTKQLELVDLRSNQIEEFIHPPERSSTHVILADNQICKESDVSHEFCMAPTDNTTYPGPPSNCVASSCSAPLVSSPNCHCANPFKGILFFPVLSSLSLLGNASMYNDIRYALLRIFKEAQIPVDSVALRQTPSSFYDNLLMDIEIFPSGEQSFNITEILDLRFVLKNMTTEASNPYFILLQGDSNFITEVSNSRGPKSKWYSTGIIVAFAAAGFVLVAILLFTGMHAFRWKRQSEQATGESNPFALWDSKSGSGAVPHLQGPRSFTFEELKKYTNNFAVNNRIGAGGYGMVYKGSLPDGQLIAIKRAQNASIEHRVQFKTEIEVLSRVHHKNLVGVVGFCFDQDEHMLVYEYIVNGTLKDSLLGRSGIKLDWKRRLKIALEAARGVQYLHELADPPIIHRDIKTNNILLDARLVAKVADFGLSKPLSDPRTHVTTQVKGTMGYLDPEYYMNQQLTEKSDVYSFGVVMLELITARNPIEKGKYIVREVIETMNRSEELYNLQEMLDPTIGLSSELRGLERFVDLSLRCVAGTGHLRPRMSEVVKELELIMELAGHNHYAESSSSASTGYEAISVDYSHPYSNESISAYSGGLLPPKLQPK